MAGGLKARRCSSCTYGICRSLSCVAGIQSSFLFPIQDAAKFKRFQLGSLQKVQCTNTVTQRDAQQLHTQNAAASYNKATPPTHAPTAVALTDHPTSKDLPTLSRAEPRAASALSHCSSLPMRFSGLVDSAALYRRPTTLYTSSSMRRQDATSLCT